MLIYKIKEMDMGFNYSMMVQNMKVIGLIMSLLAMEDT